MVLISTALIRFWLLIIEVGKSTDLTFRFKRFGEGTGIPRLVRFFGPQQTALLEKPH